MPDAVQSRLLFANQPAIPMIEPKRVLRALAEHWALLEPLCEHFDQGTLSLNELRTQLAAQQLDSTPQDITSLLDVWIRLDILVPVAKSPNRFELNAQIHDFLAYLRREHRLGLCLEIEAYLRHLERLAGYIQDAFDIRDGNDLARQLRLLDMRVRDVLKNSITTNRHWWPSPKGRKPAIDRFHCASVTLKCWRPGTNTSSR